jgi:hypothetical protein
VKNTEQNVNDEPKVMKERIDTEEEISAPILGRHLTVYMWPWNSCIVLKSLFFVNDSAAAECIWHFDDKSHQSSFC